MADSNPEKAVAKAAAFVVDNWETLGVEEHDGVLHLPAALKRRNKSGGIDEVPVMLRNVTNPYKFKARVQARTMATTLWSLDLDRDRDQVEQLENYCLLAYAIRDPKTFDQHVMTAELLLQRYDTQALAEIWGRYNVWVEMLDPRFGELDAEQLWQVIARIAREKTPAPLVSMPSREQFSCIVSMASAACTSPNRPSWLQ
jgi:hypothetical protein